MSWIFDQGVSLADWDPKGLGGLAWASVERTHVTAGNVTLPLNMGDTVDGAYLRTSGYSAFNNQSYQSERLGEVLSGTWRCLGYVDENAGWGTNNTSFATMWMRVA